MEEEILLESGHHEFFKKIISLKDKILRVIFISAILIIALLLLLSYLINYENLKFNLEQKISRNLNANFIIKEAKPSILPSPQIIIKEAEITNYFQGEKTIDFKAKEIKIKLGFWSLLSRDFEIKKVIINEALIESYYKSAKPKHKQVDITKLLNQKDSEIKKNKGFSLSLPLQNVVDEKFSIKKIPLFVIKNSQIHSYSRSGSFQSFNKIELKIKNKVNELLMKGEFLIDNSLNRIKITNKTHISSGENQTILNLDSAELNLAITGKISGKKKKLKENEQDFLFNNNFEGKLEMQINNVRSFYEKYVNKSDFWSTKINPLANSIKINGKISKNDDQTKISNLIINSELINGSGEIEFDSSNKIPTIDIDFNLENIDLDKLRIDRSVYENQITNNQSEYERLVSKSLQVLEKKERDENEILKNTLENEIKQKNFELTAEITVKNIEYLKGQIKDVDLYLLVSSSDHSILIQPLIFNTPGQGTVRISGILSGDQTNPKFVGKIDAFGQKLSEILKWGQIELQNLKHENLNDFTLYSDLLFSENSISLNSLYFTLNESKNEVLGNIKIEKNNKVTNILSKFLINDLDIEDYFFVSQKNTYLSSGLFLRKMFWLNNINTNSITSLSFDNLTYKDETFQNQKITFGLSRGYFEVNNLELQSENMDIKTSLIFDIREKTPRLEARIDAKKFHYYTTKDERNLLDEETSSIAQNINLLTKNRNAKFDFFDQFFALPSLSEINGSVNMYFEDLKIDETQIKNLDLAGKITDGNIDIPDMKGEIFDGTFFYQGQVILKGDKAVNGNLNLNNVKIRPLLSSVLKLDKIDGTANISSSITSSAQNKKEFAENIKLNCKFSAGNVEVQGLGLTDLIFRMFRPKEYSQELQDIEKILFNKNTSTKFTKAVGSLNINKDKNKLQTNFETEAANGVLTGKVDVTKNTIDATTNIIFLTGTNQLQIPINIASNIKGPTNDPTQNSNLDQAKQYIERVKGK